MRSALARFPVQRDQRLEDLIVRRIGRPAIASEGRFVEFAAAGISLERRAGLLGGLRIGIFLDEFFQRGSVSDSVAGLQERFGQLQL